MTPRRRARPVVRLVVGAVVVVGSAQVTAAAASVVTVAVGNFYFDDATPGDGVIRIQPGDQLRFVLQDDGPGTPHTVEIDEFGIHSGPLGTGDTYTTPPLDTPGTYRLYCKPHARRGHETTLVVGSGASPTTATTSPPPTSSVTTTSEASTTPGPSGATSSTTTAGAADTPSTTTGDGVSTGGGEEPTGTTVAAGVGRATDQDLDALPAAPPSRLEQAIGTDFSSDSPWTRAVQLGIVAGVPLLAAAGWAIRRTARGNDDRGDAGP